MKLTMIRNEIMADGGETGHNESHARYTQGTVLKPNSLECILQYFGNYVHDMYILGSVSRIGI